ncbi:MAG TPA: YggT family protein [Stellaceae bacterium]|nr:YggT family protein [Stellaceae bacterium]
MGGFLAPVIEAVIILLDFFWWLIIIAAVVSWLIAFGIINTYNRTVAMLTDFLYRITDPVLRPIRRLLPNLGGVDLSPLIVLLIIYVLQRWLQNTLFYVYRW